MVHLHLLQRVQAAEQSFQEVSTSLKRAREEIQTLQRQQKEDKEAKNVLEEKLANLTEAHHLQHEQCRLLFEQSKQSHVKGSSPEPFVEEIPSSKRRKFPCKYGCGRMLAAQGTGPHYRACPSRPLEYRAAVQFEGEWYCAMVTPTAKHELVNVAYDDGKVETNVDIKNISKDVNKGKSWILGRWQ